MANLVSRIGADKSPTVEGPTPTNGRMVGKPEVAFLATVMGERFLHFQLNLYKSPQPFLSQSDTLALLSPRTRVMDRHAQTSAEKENQNDHDQHRSQHR